MFGWTEILIVALIIILLFGATKLPKLARSIGLSVGEFKEGLEESKQDSSASDSDELPDESTNPPG